MTLPEVRCPKCRRLLLKGAFTGQIKCPKCKLIVVRAVEPLRFPPRPEITT